MNNVSDGEAQYIAETRYQRIRMLPEMSLANFVDAFELVAGNMKTLKCDPLLDRDRFEEYMRGQHRGKNVRG